jgi:hypothetical protein
MKHVCTWAQRCRLIDIEFLQRRNVRLIKVMISDERLKMLFKKERTPIS